MLIGLNSLSPSFLLFLECYHPYEVRIFGHYKKSDLFQSMISATTLWPNVEKKAIFTSFYKSRKDSRKKCKHAVFTLLWVKFEDPSKKLTLTLRGHGIGIEP